MADPCTVLAVLFWLGLGAWIVYVIFRPRRPAVVTESHSRRWRRCIRCGEEFTSDRARCPVCKLDPRSETAGEFYDLEATARVMQTLLESGGLTAELCDEVYRAIEARQQQLMHQGARARTAEHGNDAAAQALVQRLEQALGSDAAREQLTVEQKRQVLAMYRTLREEELRPLSADALRGLAKLLAAVGLTSRALNTYQLLASHHPGAACYGDACFEAGELAFKRELWPQALRFFERAADQPASAQRHAVLYKYLEELAARLEKPVPVVLVDPAPAAPPIEAPRPAPAAPPRPERAREPKPVPVPVPPVPPPPPPPRRTLLELLAGFMEQSNILWGELVGGLLIVGCSIALVISLWQSLEEIPYFPFLVFASITAALFGAGFYTQSHWKLESTSRGLLIIGTLLVPLDFLVLAGLTRESAYSLREAGTELAALLLFGWLLARAARLLVATPLHDALAALLLAGTMLAPGIAQLLGPHWLMEQGEASLAFFVLSGGTAVCFAAGMGTVLGRAARRPSWGPGELGALAFFLGATAFAAVVALGFLLACHDDGLEARDRLALPVALLGLPILAWGAVVRDRLDTQARPEGAEAWEPGGWIATATALALGSCVVQFAGFALALALPGLRLGIGLMNAAALALLAGRFRRPLLHVPVQVYLVLLAALGTLTELDRLTPSPEAALRLAALVGVQALAAEVWLHQLRWGRRGDALPYAIGSGVSAVLALALAVPFWRSAPAQTAVVIALSAVSWLIANLRWQRPELTYLCALGLTGSIALFLRSALPGLAAELAWLWALLAHASACLGLSLACRILALERRRPELMRVYQVPLWHVSLCLSVGAALLLPLTMAETRLTPAAWAAGWLAMLWLMMALAEGRPGLFAAFQVALALALAVGCLAGLHDADVVLDPRRLLFAALPIAGLGLVWELLRGQAATNEQVRRLLRPSFPAADRVLLVGVLVSLYVLAALLIVPGVVAELGTGGGWQPLPAEWYGAAYASPGLVLWGLLLVVMLLLWSRGADTRPVVGVFALLLTLPLLVAAYHLRLPYNDAASGLRWYLALAYVAGSAVLWLVPGVLPRPLLRGMLLVGSVVPALGISGVAAVLSTTGAIAGPLPGSVFHGLGRSLSLLLPLLLFSAAFSGHGFRERLPGYLLAAGVLLNVTFTSGYALRAVAGHAELEPQQWVELLQIGATCGWAWLIVWQLAARKLEPGPAPLGRSPLLQAQVVLAATQALLALVPAVLLLIFADGADRPWVAQTGSSVSWLVLGLALYGSGLLCRSWFGVLPLHYFGAFSLTSAGLLACTVESWAPGYGLVCLQLGMGILAVGWSWLHTPLARGEPARWHGASAERDALLLYTLLPTALAALLSLHALILGAEQLPSAASAALPGVALLLLARQRREEAWALAASPLLVVACSYLVWLWHASDPTFSWLLTLAQLDLTVLGLLSLYWLWRRRALYAAEITLPTSPLLAVQVGVGAVASAVPVLVGLWFVLLAPAQPAALLRDTAEVGGWAALLTTFLALGWYLALIRPSAGVHAVGWGGLLLGVLAAGVSESLGAGDWVAEHVLALAWTMFALALLTVSWASHARIELGPRPWSPERRQRLASVLRTYLPAAPCRMWVAQLGATVIVLALRSGWVEPRHPVGPVLSTLGAGVLLAGLAIWSRWPAYSYASCGTLNLAALLLYGAWLSPHLHQRGPILGNAELAGLFVSAQVLSFALAGALWGGMEWLLARTRLGAVMLPCAQAALLLGTHLLAILVAGGSSLHLIGLHAGLGEGLAWLALLALVGATLANLWDPRTQGPGRAQLYSHGLIAQGLCLLSLDLAPTRWYLVGVVLLAAYLVLCAALVRLLGRRSIPSPAPVESSTWFWHVEVALGGFVLILAPWLTLGYTTGSERLCGALATGLVTLLALLLLPAWPILRPAPAAGSARALLRYQLGPCQLVLALGAGTVLLFAWSWVDPATAHPWLQRGGLALAVVTALTLALRFPLAFSPADPRWRAASLAQAPVLAATAGAVALIFLGQEFFSYQEAVHRTPLEPLVGILAGLALLALFGLALFEALCRRPDLWQLPVGRRGLYVYLAEGLLLALLLHLRLNVPDFPPPVLGAYWPLSLLVLAFAGIGLAEWCARRGAMVLVAPLRRSAQVVALLPVVAFLACALGDWRTPLAQTIPGMRPLLRSLDRLETLPFYQALHALCWLLLGLFYGWLAYLRSSANFGLLAALAVNFAFWVLLSFQESLAFLVHPQLWLVPLGLIFLATEFIHRDRLGRPACMTLRYLGLLCIYLSSTADMFIAGLGNSVLLPIVLALVAVAGMLLGILLRVRAFLLVGLSFLLLVIVAQIWHAAVDRHQTWVWWASGILLGTAILTLFALFEKHRNGVLKIVEDVKRWR